MNKQIERTNSINVVFLSHSRDRKIDVNEEWKEPRQLRCAYNNMPINAYNFLNTHRSLIADTEITKARHVVSV